MKWKPKNVKERFRKGKPKRANKESQRETNTNTKSWKKPLYKPLCVKFHVENHMLFVIASNEGVLHGAWVTGADLAMKSSNISGAAFASATFQSPFKKLSALDLKSSPATFKVTWVGLMLEIVAVVESLFLTTVSPNLKPASINLAQFWSAPLSSNSLILNWFFQVAMRKKTYRATQHLLMDMSGTQPFSKEFKKCSSNMQGKLRHFILPFFWSAPHLMLVRSFPWRFNFFSMQSLNNWMNWWPHSPGVVDFFAIKLWARLTVKSPNSVETASLLLILLCVLATSFAWM